MQRTSVSLPDEQMAAIDEIVRVSNGTPEIPVLKKSEVVRMLMAEGFESLQNGEISVRDTPLNQFVTEDIGSVEPDDPDEGETVVCPHCEYQWTYTGGLSAATCPSCSGKAPVPGRTDGRAAGADRDGTEVECEHCEYEWTYSGERRRATCPNCSQTTATGLE